MDFNNFKKTIEHLPEYEIYFIIEEYGMTVIKLEEAIKHKMVDLTEDIKQKLIDADKIINMAVQETVKFGVDDFIIKNNLVEDTTPKYREWYRFWKSWRYHMSDEDWIGFCKAREKGENLSAWLPKEKWNDS